MMLVLLLVALVMSVQVRAIRGPLRDIYTNPIDYTIWRAKCFRAKKRAIDKHTRDILERRLGGFKPRWNQRISTKNGLKIYTPWYFNSKYYYLSK